MFRMLDPLPLPTLCAVCRAWTDAPVCGACRADHARLIPRCPSCALPLAPGLSLCTRCTDAPPDPGLNCLARVPYEWPWTDVVTQFKFRGQPAWAREMARMMMDIPGVPALLKEAHGMIPVPLTTQRLVERGYNQAWELVRHLRKASGALACPDALLRRQTTQWQHQLSQSEREAHARQAFAVNPQHLDRLRGGHWVLVDDVMTTGATLRAAARHLLDAGAHRVSALVFARTPTPDRSDTQAEFEVE